MMSSGRWLAIGSAVLGAGALLAVGWLIYARQSDTSFWAWPGTAGVVTTGVGFVTMIIGFVMPKDEGAQPAAAVSVAGSPYGQAIGQVQGGVSIGPGAHFPNAVFHVAGERAGADRRLAEPESGGGDLGQEANTAAPSARPEPIHPPARRASQTDVLANTGGDETAQSEPRVTCPLSPKELIRLFALGSTDVQGKKLIAQYKEQWREVSATVGQVETTVSGSSLYVSCKDSDQMAVGFFFEPNVWGARLAGLMPGDKIKATGQVYFVNRIMVIFDCCELVYP
jgi:hypothetical protein